MMPREAAGESGRAGAGATTRPEAIDWSRAASGPEFRRLVELKRNTTGPLLFVSLSTFIVVTLLAGFARPWMTERSIGPLSNGLLLVILMYLVCWAAGIAYVLLADRRYDPQAERTARSLEERP